MELRHLRYVVALDRERHFGRAARSLHVVQSALSQQVRQLERELGVELFARTTRRVEVTEAGARLVQHALAVLATIERAEQDLADLAAGRTGRVSVGFVGTATYEMLPRVAQEVRRSEPGIDLRVRGEMLTPELVRELRAGTLDVAVLRPVAGAPADGLVHQSLRTEALVAVLPSSHRLAGRPQIGLAELASEPFVMHPSDHRSSIHEHVRRACAAAGFSPVSTTEVAETATLVASVAAGLGVALIPAPVRALGLTGVRYVPLVAAPTIDLDMALRGDDASPASRRVAEIVRRCADS